LKPNAVMRAKPAMKPKQSVRAREIMKPTV
jgi:hypothetical protein